MPPTPTNPTTLLREAVVLLSDTESYLSALYGAVARHDHLGADLTCGGCTLRDRITAARRVLGTTSCGCPHPVDEHSVYGCAEDCACEWMPSRTPAAPPAPADRAAVLAEVDWIVEHCPDHGCVEPETAVCHCEIADRLRRLADGAAAGVQPPTSEARCSYRLEHRRPGETTWQRNTPGIGANWSWQSREKADQRLAEARDRWPDFEHRLIETTTTVTEQPAAPAAPEETK